MLPPFHRCVATGVRARVHEDICTHLHSEVCHPGRIYSEGKVLCSFSWHSQPEHRILRRSPDKVTEAN